MALAEGVEIGGYRIDGVVGRGGMGVVYLATQLNLDRKVALKVVAPELAENEDFRERFKRESRLAASIEHAHVIPVYEADESGDTLFITMRYVHGTDLRALIQSQGRLEPKRAARILGQVASALDAAHARGLVHRDVKPANVLVAQEDGQDHAYLTDFGLTKNVSSESGMTKTGMMVGTIDYVPPEQIEGRKLDARTDVYALGCVLFQSLSGRVPFAKDSDIAKMWAHMNEQPPSLLDLAPDLPAELDEVCARAMAKDPEQRYLSTGDLGRAALAAAQGQATTRAERSVAQGAAAPDAAGVTSVGAATDRTIVDAMPSPEPDTGAVTRPPASNGTAVGHSPAPAPGTVVDGAPPPPRAGDGPDAGGSSRRPLIFAGAALAAIAILAVVLVVVLGGGGDDGGSSASQGSSPSEPAQPEPSEPAAPGGGPADEESISQTLNTWFGGGSGTAKCALVTDGFLRGQNGKTGAAGRAECADYVGGNEARKVKLHGVKFTSAGAEADFTHGGEIRETAIMVKQGDRWLIDDFVPR